MLSPGSPAACVGPSGSWCAQSIRKEGSAGVTQGPSPSSAVLAILAPVRRANEGFVLGSPFSSDLKLRSVGASEAQWEVQGWAVPRSSHEVESLAKPPAPLC